MLTAIRIPILGLPLVIPSEGRITRYLGINPSYIEGPSLYNKESEQDMGFIKNYRVIKEFYKGIWPLLPKLRVYRAYLDDEETSYSLCFPFIDRRERKSFYLQEIKSRNPENGVLSNLQTLEEVIVNDLFSEGCEQLVVFVKKPTLIKAFKRKLGYEKMKFKGLVELMNGISSTLGRGYFMAKTQ